MLFPVNPSTMGQDIVARVLLGGAETIKTMFVNDREPRSIERLEGDFANGVVETMCELLNFQLPEYRPIMRELLIGIVNDDSNLPLAHRLLAVQAVFDAYPSDLEAVRDEALSQMLWLDSSFADDHAGFIRNLLAACRVLAPRLT